MKREKYLLQDKEHSRQVQTELVPLTEALLVEQEQVSEVERSQEK